MFWQYKSKFTKSKTLGENTEVYKQLKTKLNKIFDKFSLLYITLESDFLL